MERPIQPEGRRMQRIDPARLLAWLLVALALVLALAGLAASFIDDPAPTHLLFGPIAAIAYALVGGLAAMRQPRNPIGWLFCAVGLSAGLTLLAVNETALCRWSGAFPSCIVVARW